MTIFGYELHVFQDVDARLTSSPNRNPQIAQSMTHSQESTTAGEAGTASPIPLWQNPLVAYIGPFVLFMILGAAEGWEPLKEYYPFVYSAKILAVFLLWLACRSRYPEFSSQGFALATVVGIAGVVAWVGLWRLNLESYVADLLPSWLYSANRAEYNPFAAISSATAAWGFVAVRLFGLAVLVPLMEEVFWRGFLIRYLVSDDFERIPIGRYTPLSFAVVTLLFTLAHPELLAAAVWCAAINWLLYRTKNLWACILAHAVTNLLLGVYILATGTWVLW